MHIALQHFKPSADAQGQVIATTQPVDPNSAYFSFSSKCLTKQAARAASQQQGMC